MCQIYCYYFLYLSSVMTSPLLLKSVSRVRVNIFSFLYSFSGLQSCHIKLNSLVCFMLGLPWWFNCKESACSVGEVCLIPGLGRFPGEGNGNSVQYSYLRNPMDRGPQQATVHGVAKRVGHSLATKEMLRPGPYYIAFFLIVL